MIGVVGWEWLNLSGTQISLLQSKSLMQLVQDARHCLSLINLLLIHLCHWTHLRLSQWTVQMEVPSANKKIPLFCNLILVPWSQARNGHTRWRSQRFEGLSWGAGFWHCTYEGNILTYLSFEQSELLHGSAVVTARWFCKLSLISANYW